MKASSRWSGVTWGDANYWCLCPSGKERGLTDLKCSFLLHFGAQSLFFKNAKQCFCITGKLHVSVSNVMPRLPISFHEAGDVQRKTMSLSEHCSTGVWHDFWVFQYGKQFKITCLTCSKRPREKRVTEAVSLEFTSLVSPVMYFLAYAIVKNRNHKWNKILTWLKINKTSFVCSQSDRFKRCAHVMLDFCCKLAPEITWMTSRCCVNS